MSLSSPTMGKITRITTAMGSKVPWLSLPSVSHGSKSWDWFPSESNGGYEQQRSIESKSVGSEEANGDEREEIRIERPFDVESVSSPRF